MMTKARRKAQPIEDELLLDLDQDPIVFRESLHRQVLLDPQTGKELWSLTTDQWLYD